MIALPRYLRNALPSLCAVMLLISTVVAPDAPGALGQSTPPETWTILLMGVDRRPGEPIDEGVRPDALGVLHLDAAAGTCRLLSIPRDTRALVPGYGVSKVNHAHAFGGVDLQRQTVEALLGIELDRFGLIDMLGFALMIDAVNGITVQEPEVFETGPYAYESSPQVLNGAEAMFYSRYRGGPDGDFGRIRRQQQLIRSFLASTVDLDVGTFIRETLPLLRDHTRTDMSLEELVRLATEFRDTCTAETIGLDLLNGTPSLAYDDIYQQNLSMVLVDPAEIESKVAWLLGG